MPAARKPAKNWSRYAVPAVVLVGLVVLGYSLYITIQSGAAESGVVVCPQPDTCYLTAHIHAYIPIEICGEERRLPIEVGSLQQQHTHEEENTLHWHDRMPYDNVNKRPLQPELLRLGAFFEAVGIAFTSEQILDKKNGDACPEGGVGTWKMFVNGFHNEEFNNYIWSDKDVIVLVFDARTPQEVEAELRENPVVFPVLGRG